MTDQSPSSTQLSGSRLTLARVIWAILVGACLAVFVFSAVERFRHPLNEGCQVIECNPIDLTDQDLEMLPGVAQSSELVTWALLIVALVWNLTYLGAAVLIVARRSDDWIALLVSFTLIVLGTIAFSPANSILRLTVPATNLLLDLLSNLGYITLFLLLLVFPDGQFVPRWTRWLTPLLLMFVLYEVVLVWGLFTVVAYVIVVAYSQIRRYRSYSSALERQQTKWVAVGLASQLFIIGSWIVIASLFPADAPSAARTTTLLIVLPSLVLVGSLFPICVSVAVLRYRLWDVDIVINRTLVYGSLTGVLIAVYSASVVLLQGILRELTGQESPLAVVASTLVIAALFNPLRQRIQAAIDRRLYRRKYDASRTLEAFGERLQDQVDLSELSGSLLDAVEQSVQPNQASLWLKEQR